MSYLEITSLINTSNFYSIKIYSTLSTAYTTISSYDSPQIKEIHHPLSPYSSNTRYAPSSVETVSTQETTVYEDTPLPP